MSAHTIDELRNYHFYAKNFLKIKTKLQGIHPFILRKYQRKFIDFTLGIKGPVRVIALKPRQAGFSTLISSFLTHLMVTNEHFMGMAMADKKGRTQAIASIYKTFINELPPSLVPMISINNTEQLIFDNKDPEQDGLGSGLIFETANDPNAGRSSSRRFAHLSETAFYRNSNGIDEGVQNSIPLTGGTYIFKESTANGRAGIGKSFFELWNAAKAGDSIYQPFFVAWYEVDDYAIAPPRGFTITPEESDILKRIPDMTVANIVWRRLKIREYQTDDEGTILSPDERFKQDFPLTDTEAFLSTGMPVFDNELVDLLIGKLSYAIPRDLTFSLDIKGHVLNMYKGNLIVYAPPRAGKTYFIGADVAEGLVNGDSSSACVIDEGYVQIARWHGKIDPDLFGHLLIDLGKLYNTALLVPENNNMGHTTITTIKNEAYPKLYKEIVEDKITRQVTEKLGWGTTEKSKMDMLNELIKRFRDGDFAVRDLALAREMLLITREDTGKVNLNGRDRIVAACLACIARRQTRVIEVRPRGKLLSSAGTGQEIHDSYMKGLKRKDNDMFT